MGLLEFFDFKTKAKVNYLVKIIESAHGEALKSTQQKGNYFASAFSGNPVEYSWTPGSVCGIYCRELREAIEEIDRLISSNEELRFSKEDMLIFKDALEKEIKFAKGFFPNIEHKIINEALHWHEAEYIGYNKIGEAAKKRYYKEFLKLFKSD